MISDVRVQIRNNSMHVCKAKASGSTKRPPIARTISTNSVLRNQKRIREKVCAESSRCLRWFRAITFALARFSWDSTQSACGVSWVTNLPCSQTSSCHLVTSFRRLYNTHQHTQHAFSASHSPRIWLDSKDGRMATLSFALRIDLETILLENGHVTH